MDEHTTPAEYEEIEKLKEQLKDVQISSERFGDGEQLYVRWLRAKKHKIKDAAEAIRKYLKHRETFNLDTIENWEPCEAARPYLQYEFLGYDEDSCPVYYLPWGAWDMKKLIRLDCARDEITRFCQLEELGERQLLEKSVELGKHLPGVCFVVDLDKFSLKDVLSKTAMEIILEMATIADTIFLPSSKVWGIFNVPKAFYYLYKLISPVMSAESRNMLQMHPKSNELPEFFKMNNIPDSCVPTVLGGKYELNLTQ